MTELGTVTISVTADAPLTEASALTTSPRSSTTLPSPRSSTTSPSPSPAPSESPSPTPSPSPPSPLQASPSQDANQPAFSLLLNDRTRVRLNAATQTAQDTDQPHRRKVALIKYMFFWVPTLIATAIVCGMFHEEQASCETPVLWWMIVQAFLTLVNLSRVAYCYKYDTDELPWGAFRVSLLLEVFEFAWFVIGNIWLSRTLTYCKGPSPHLTSMFVAMIVIKYVFLLSVILMLVILLLCMCLCFPCIVRLLVRFSGKPVKGGSKKEIAKLHKAKFAPGVLPEDQTSCAICLGDYEDGEYVRILECDGKHNFHQQCIDDWLVLNGSCPNCRTIVVGPSKVAQDEEAESTDAETTAPALQDEVEDRV